MRRKVDANHAKIKQAFLDLGCSVHDTSDVGCGFPDLVVGVAFRNLLVEIKSEFGELTPDQRHFIERWRGSWCLVRTVDDVISLVQGVRRSAR